MPKIPADSEKRISTKFQKRLRELIEENDCNKYEFASLVGVSRDVILRATLYGIIPSIQSLIRIADYANISLEYLLAETDEISFNKTNSSTFHERLTQLVSENKTKYSAISHKMPFPSSYFYDWLRNNTVPSLEYLRALSGHFGVSLDYLLGRTD